MPDLDAGIVMVSERDLYAIIGELFVKSQIVSGQLAQARAELRSLAVIESSEQEGPDADGES